MEWPRLIAAYEGKLWRRSFNTAFSFGISFDDEFDLITKAADLIGSETILDLACGTGIYTRPWARKLTYGFAVGLDLSRPMLSFAATKALEEGINNVLYIHANALSIPFPKGSFDRVNCCGAIHLFPNLPMALSEIYRVLKPKGVFTGACYRNWLPGKLSERIAAWQKQNLGVKYFRLHELENAFGGAGFTDIQLLHTRRDWFIFSVVKPSMQMIS